MSLFDEDGYLRADERAPKEPRPRIRKGCAIALLVAVALPSGCVFLEMKDRRERPAKVKALERVCQSYPRTDREGAKALDGLYRSASRGEIDERDVSFKSGEYNSGIYEPFPHAVEGLTSGELRISVVEVWVKGRRSLTLREPELVLLNRIGVAAASTTVVNCKRRELFAIFNAISWTREQVNDGR